MQDYDDEHLFAAEIFEEEEELIEEGLSLGTIEFLIELGLTPQDPKHKPYMKKAIELAKKSQPDDSGPYVGAVIVKNGEIKAEAYKVREPWPGLKAKGRKFLHLCHAEEKAIDLAGREAKNSTLYVTLEPCLIRNAVGRRRQSNTPCVDLIQQAGISKVVIGRIDWENQYMSGQGGFCLKKSGIEVELYNQNLEKKLERLIELGQLRRESKVKEYLRQKIESGRQRNYRVPLPDLTRVDRGKKRESNRLRKIINKGLAEYQERRNE